MNLNNPMLKEETLRSSLHQFFGSVLNSYSDPEKAIAVIMEELTKIATVNDDLTDFRNDLIKPMFKATHYILSTRYTKLLNDSKEAFGDKMPIAVKARLDNDRQLLALLDLYIKQL